MSASLSEGQVKSVTALITGSATMLRWSLLQSNVDDYVGGLRCVPL